MEISFCKGINLDMVTKYGMKLSEVAPRRNNAAHGGNYLTYDDVCTDKRNVYDISPDLIKGLIIELLEMIYPD